MDQSTVAWDAGGRKRKGKMVGPTLGGERGGRLGMEVRRVNLEEYEKCRPI
jgi:hypothetical protein